MKEFTCDDDDDDDDGPCYSTGFSQKSLYQMPWQKWSQVRSISDGPAAMTQVCRLAVVLTLDDLENVIFGVETFIGGRKMAKSNNKQKTTWNM